MAEHNTPEHVPGTMDIREQVKTFHGFIKLSTWVSIIAIGVLVFMALSNA